MDAENTSEKIAAAALRIVERAGAGSLSMRKVAVAVGVTPMALYHHFPNREALLRFVTDREFDQLVHHMRAQPHRRSPRERLLHAMDYYLDYAFAHPRVFDYVFSQHRDDARRFPTDFRARRSPTMNVVADIVGDAMDAKIIRRDDAWEVAMMLWAHVHGYVALYRAGRFALTEKALRALCMRSLERLLDGLKA